LKIGTIVRNHDSPLIRGVAELVSIVDALVRPTYFVNRTCIDAARPQRLGDLRVHVLIQQEPESHAR
jgi:hypothetical protein